MIEEAMIEEIWKLSLVYKGKKQLTEVWLRKQPLI